MYPMSNSSNPNKLSKGTLALVTAAAIGGGAIGGAIGAAGEGSSHNNVPRATGTAAPTPEASKAPKKPSAEQISMATSYQKAASNFSVNIVKKAPDYKSGGISADVYHATAFMTPNYDGAGHNKILVDGFADPKNPSAYVTTDSVELIVSSANPANVQKITVTENNDNYKADANGNAVTGKDGRPKLDTELTTSYTLSDVDGTWSAQTVETDNLSSTTSETSQPKSLQDAQKFVETMSDDLQSLGLIDIQ
jgi:hypothetical protein